ncbi:hypothetical protein FRC10_007526 [Ceratobasidium sp. 414]|nr:hypothetical protein FRC10_007526 [Ceratobasidium sp. 414]
MFSLLRPVSLCRQGYRLRSLHSSAALLAKRKSLKTFHLADIGEGITGKVSAFDPLCEVQSDKASVEITSPFDGTVAQVLVQEGHIAKVGAGLCMTEVEEDGDSASEPVKEEPRITTSAVPKAIEKAIEGSYTPPSATRRYHPLDPDRPAGSAVQAQRPDKFGKDKGSSNQALATPFVRYYACSQGGQLGRYRDWKRTWRVDRACECGCVFEWVEKRPIARSARPFRAVLTPLLHRWPTLSTSSQKPSPFARSTPDTNSAWHLLLR